MSKKIKNGFSLIELLIVVAIIGVLSSIGTLAFNSAIESSKARIAEKHFYDIVRHIKTELLILNDFISPTSPAINVPGSKIAKWEMGTNTLDEFLIGLRNYYLIKSATSFTNPFNAAGSRQVYSLSLAADRFDPMNDDKGSILLRVDPNFLADGAKTSGLRRFQAIYYQNDAIIDVNKTEFLSFKN